MLGFFFFFFSWCSNTVFDIWRSPHQEVPFVNSVYTECCSISALCTHITTRSLVSSLFSGLRCSQDCPQMCLSARPHVQVCSSGPVGKVWFSSEYRFRCIAVLSIWNSHVFPWHPITFVSPLFYRFLRGPWPMQLVLLSLCCCLRGLAAEGDRLHTSPLQRGRLALFPRLTRSLLNYFFFVAYVYTSAGTLSVFFYVLCKAWTTPMLCIAAFV